MKNIWRRSKGAKYSMVLGHRGAMGLAPENTIAGLNSGLKHQAALLEIDVHLSKDKKLIVIHDEKVDRTTTGKGFVKDLSSSYIRGLDGGIKFSKRFKGEKVPFLEEVLDFLSDKEVKLNIEIKNGPVIYKGIENKILQMIEKYNCYDKVIVSSFDHHVLMRIKEINKQVHTAILYGSNILDLEKYVKKLKVSAIHPHHFWVTGDLVKSMHKLDIAVNTWIVNDKKEYIRFSRMGVDSVGTNFPNRMKLLKR